MKKKSFVFVEMVFLITAFSLVGAKEGIFNKYNYKLGLQKTLAGGERESSGITYNPIEKTLFIVDDKRKMTEISLEGEILRDIELEGFYDTEGIAHVRDQTFAILEERKGRLVLIDIPPKVEKIRIEEGTFYDIEPNAGNNGLEGIGYHAFHNLFYIAREQFPKKVYVVGLEKGKALVREDFDGDQLPVRDLSAVAISEQWTPHILILSQKSKRIMEVDKDGKVVSSFSLIPYVYFGKTEGLAIDEKGRIYVVIEKGNENFFRFDPH